MTQQLPSRESPFELLRILAQLFIVYYHILLNVVFPATGDPLYRALWRPLHIGVPLFVLLSGYFGIKPSVRGLVRLLGTMFVIHIPLSLCQITFAEGGGNFSRCGRRRTICFGHSILVHAHLSVPLSNLAGNQPVSQP